MLRIIPLFLLLYACDSPLRVAADEPTPIVETSRSKALSAYSKLHIGQKFWEVKQLLGEWNRSYQNYFCYEVCYLSERFSWIGVDYRIDVTVVDGEVTWRSLQ
jgi:hypothetical protein